MEQSSWQLLGGVVVLGCDSKGRKQFFYECTLNDG